MRISLSTGTLFTFPLGKVVTIAREAGFDGVELNIRDPEAVRPADLKAYLGEDEQIA